MGIKLGSSDLSNFYVGSKEAQSLYLGSKEIWTADPFDYDFVLRGNYDEVDILYTTDTHLCWLDSGTSQYAEAPVFELGDVGYYNDKLWNAGIPTFCVDCGDWDHGTGGQTQIDQIINMFNNCGTKGLGKYLSVTFGNHEWYAAMGDAASCLSYLDRVDNFTACNLLVDGELRYKPYRAIKIGDHKIGIISVGYPSPNGRGNNPYGDTHVFENCTFYDAKRNENLQPTSALYVQVQSYIDLMKANGFEYIICNTHMDKYSDEDFDDDGRFNSRADFLIRNTDGLDVVIPGHWNHPINATYTFTGTGGKTGIIVQEAGASFHNIGRLRFRFNESKPIQSYLLTSRSDLEVVS